MRWSNEKDGDMSLFFDHFKPENDDYSDPIPDKKSFGDLCYDIKKEVKDYKTVDLQKEFTEKLMTKIMSKRDELLIAWMAETGIKPSEAELVEYRNVLGELRFFVRKREINE